MMNSNLKEKTLLYKMLAPPITVGLSSLVLPLYLTRLPIVDAFEFVAVFFATPLNAVARAGLADVDYVGLSLRDDARFAEDDVRGHCGFSRGFVPEHMPRQLFQVFHVLTFPRPGFPRTDVHRHANRREPVCYGR